MNCYITGLEMKRLRIAKVVLLQIGGKNHVLDFSLDIGMRQIQYEELSHLVVSCHRRDCQTYVCSSYKLRCIRHMSWTSLPVLSLSSNGMEQQPQVMIHCSDKEGRINLHCKMSSINPSGSHCRKLYVKVDRSTFEVVRLVL